MRIRHILSAVSACAVAATALAVSASATTAGITFQTSSYAYRDTVDQTVLLKWSDEMGEGVDIGGTYTDAVINGDGTYTVSLSFDCEDAGWNMLKVEFDETVDFVVTPTEVKLDGVSVDFDADAAAGDEKNRVQLINVYDNLAVVPNEMYSTIEVTFEVSGLGGGAADDNNAAPADGNTDTAPAPTTPSADKGSPDTGVEGVAVVAGLAIAASGAVLLSKKRK